MGNQATTQQKNFSTPFDEFWAALRDAGGTVSADEFRTMLSEMMAKKKAAEDKARKERREAARPKATKKAAEKPKPEISAEEEAAHVAEVTSMELPLDWENAFGQYRAFNS